MKKCKKKEGEIGGIKGKCVDAKLRMEKIRRERYREKLN